MVISLKKRGVALETREVWGAEIAGYDIDKSQVNEFYDSTSKNEQQTRIGSKL